MPLFIEVTRRLRNLVPMHDVQDLIPNLLTLVATSANRSQCPSRPKTDVWVFLPHATDLVGQGIGGASQLPRLGVVVALPIQQAHVGKPLPHEDPAPDFIIHLLSFLFIRVNQKR
eukprot:Skav235173  [mRNA]  locus=scaffold721:186589:188170:+ [translate_table: standard]